MKIEKEGAKIVIDIDENTGEINVQDYPDWVLGSLIATNSILVINNNGNKMYIANPYFFSRIYTDWKPSEKLLKLFEYGEMCHRNDCKHYAELNINRDFICFDCAERKPITVEEFHDPDFDIGYRKENFENFYEVDKEKIKQFTSQQKSHGFVYFIQSGDDGPIKIGYSISVESRLRALQTSNPESLSLLCAIPGDIELETEYHKKYKAYRLNGEWFKPEQEILDEIERLITMER